MAGIKELVCFLLLCISCTKTNQTFVLDTTITYPEERIVAVAWPVIPVEIDILK